MSDFVDEFEFKFGLTAEEELEFLEEENETGTELKGESHSLPSGESQGTPKSIPVVQFSRKQLRSFKKNQKYRLKRRYHTLVRKNITPPKQLVRSYQAIVRKDAKASDPTPVSKTVNSHAARIRAIIRANTYQ